MHRCDIRWFRVLVFDTGFTAALQESGKWDMEIRSWTPTLSVAPGGFIPSRNSQRLVAQEMTGHLEFAEH